MANACLFSGGKDSTLALHKAIGLGIKIDILITFVSSNPDSYMFHYPNVRWTGMQAEALGIRQVFANTEGEKERELEDLERVLKENNVSAIVTGATYSAYQAGRINRIAERNGMEHISPLWHIDPIEELDYISDNFNAIITSVSAEGFTSDMLGRRIDKGMIEKLKLLNSRYGANMLFEGGEAESFVLDAPLFKKRILIKSARKELKSDSGRYIIEDAELMVKDKK